MGYCATVRLQPQDSQHADYLDSLSVQDTCIEMIAYHAMMRVIEKLIAVRALV